MPDQAGPQKTNTTVAATADLPEGEQTVSQENQPIPPAAAQSVESEAAETQEPRPKVQTYTVAEGDTISGIAQRFGLKSRTVLDANNLSEDDLLQVGQELKIPAVDGIVHVVEEGDILWNIAADYGVEFTEIVKANPDIDAELLQPGQVLLVPGGERLERRPGIMVASRGGGGSGSFGLWPLSGTITDYLGWRTHPVHGYRHYHDGIDIAVPEGTPVAAVARGRVTYVGRLGGYGIVVRLDHGDGVETLYAHLSETMVEPGQTVGSGEQIALSGNTGASTGPHLHFSVFVGGSPVDPMAWLP
ncbi:MAG: peptidoglycan DD-metalloendopeptidase family protein [Bacillota bacterium]